MYKDSTFTDHKELFLNFHLFIIELKLWETPCTMRPRHQSSQ